MQGLIDSGALVAEVNTYQVEGEQLWMWPYYVMLKEISASNSTIKLSFFLVVALLLGL
jgi:hypothetical protein